MCFSFVVDPNFLQDTGIPLNLETHGGEDVAIFARGPMAHLIHGVHEQNYINRFMRFASCMGRDSNKPHCVDVSVNVATSTWIDLSLVLSAAIFNIIRQISL